MYQERASRVPGAVLWRLTLPASGSAQRVLPDGCMDLIWADGELLVAGPDTEAHLVPGSPGARYVGLRFAPGRGPAVLGVPAHELRDRRVPLSDLWPSVRVRRLADQAGAVADPGAALEWASAGRLREAASPDPVMAGVAAGVVAGAPVADMAAEAGISERQLHRRCLAVFGYGPKTLGRILRMNRAVDMARTGMPFADVAVAAGYADQAHLAREVKALAGVPLSTLLS
ncbi:helix-turn-helix transcriptional regulator [Planotetraspora sp. A-T 1434]|uniref:helix-turn-helix transcriptional regulator n=1 Tax=Planotetraspora sp. A-T 1434 TaxID=2979219 RepID=UPI0021C09D16|nr:helix-turn-helix transcriptional regulator [Planotetraspora sp. A-T 1434]MCT9933058.1 helix-turn-helix transcriptional regulator [Planotetraspora sp. A-T 1434]